MINNKSYTRGSGLLEGFLSKKRAQKANSFIKDSKRNGKILDIGCGSHPYFLENIKFREKYGIDPSLRISKLNDINLSKSIISKKPLLFKDNFFDVITMLAVFEHIELNVIDFVLREIKRILKKDGTFIITTPAPWADKILHNMAKIGLISPEEIHEHKSHYNIKEIISLLLNSGYKKEHIKSGYFELGFNIWLAIENEKS